MKITTHRLPVVRRIACVFALVLFMASTGASQRHEHVVDTWKPLHYDVDLNFDDQLSELRSARTKITLRVLAPTLDEIDLDFGDLPIDSLMLSGKPVRFERTAEKLNVFLPAPAKQGLEFQISVAYHGHPKDGLVFAKDRDGNPSATGDNWPNRVHYWIPSLDHPSAKATVSFTISAPQRYQVIANGKFINLRESTGNLEGPRFTFDEAKAIPPYCMIVTVNQGAYLPTPYEPIPLAYNVPQKDRDYAMRGFAPAADAISFFAQTIRAPFPYEKLALIIGATRYGGMENSSAIVFTSTLFDPRPNDRMSPRFGIPTRIEDVVAHEIAHQWFGDSVTESTWADLWLSEGFATYFAGMFIEKYDGEAAFREYMRNAAQRYFRYEQQKNLPIHDTQTQDLMQLLNPNNYEKGAWVLHMLRKQLGDEVFFKGLRDYYEAHHERNATTDDLRAALEGSSGKNLREFFARWVFGTGHPRYQVVSDLSGDGKVLRLTINQLQAGEAFLDPIPIAVTVNGDIITRTLLPESKRAVLFIPVKGKPTQIEIDPDDTLLKEIVK